MEVDKSVELVAAGSEFAVVENSPKTREVRLMARAEMLGSRDDRGQREGVWRGCLEKKEAPPVE